MLQPIIKELFWKKHKKRKQSVATAVSRILFKRTLLNIWAVLSSFMETKVFIRISRLLINDLLLYRELKYKKKKNKLKVSAVQKLISQWQAKRRKNHIKGIKVTVKRVFKTLQIMIIFRFCVCKDKLEQDNL